VGDVVDGPALERRDARTFALAAAILGLFLAGALWRSGMTPPATPLEPPQIAWTRGDPAVAAIIRIECARYDVPETFALCVADRESRFDPQAIGDHGDAVGLYQFHLGTWQHFRTRMGLPADDLRSDARQAARTACWAFANGFQQRWTVVRLGLCPALPLP
jgi:soluble lytic murein transglycosylase-like protein